MSTQYIYVMGAGSGAGKSTVCMGLLAQLLAWGYAPEQLAYIKPVTQCLVTQKVALFCEQQGIPYLDIGPLVFKKGFTRRFIDGQAPTSSELLAEISVTIDQLSHNKALVIIDGIGHPAVGSVVGVSNAEVASAFDCKIIFVANPGIGAAIDNAVLGISFLQAKGFKNIGVIFNKIPSASLEATLHYVSKRLPELLPDVKLLGFIGEEPIITNDFSKVLDQNWFSTWIDIKSMEKWLGLKLK